MIGVRGRGLKDLKTVVQEQEKLYRLNNTIAPEKV